MNEINGMVAETDMNIREYAESTIQLIDKMDYIDAIESSYFTEAKKSDDENAVDAEKQKSLLEKIKASVTTFFDKLIHLIPNMIKKLRTSSRIKRVDDIGTRLDKMTKAGVDLGKIKVSIPNIQTYDSFVMEMITQYAAKFDMKQFNKFLGAVYGPSGKIDKLIKNVNKMTSELSSGEATKNNINKILKEAYKKYPVYGATHRATRGAANLADQVRRNNAYFDSQVKKATKGSKNSDITKETELKFEFTNDIYNEGIELADITGADANFAYAGTARGTTGVILGGGIFAFALFGATVFSEIKQFFSNAPGKVKTEVITVKALYKRVTDMKLDVLEKRFVNNVNQSRAGILKGMTLEEFAKSDDKHKGLVKAAQKLCELLNAYFKFELAELNYYDRILIEVDSKLSVKGEVKTGKKSKNVDVVVTKESADEVVNMEDFMDLESFSTEN